MKAARAKTPRKREKASGNDGARETVKIEALRQQITKLVADDALEMVSTTIEQVKNGQYQALKYLFEMVGLYPAATVAETPQEDSLAKILLSRLGISEGSGADPETETTSKPAVPRPDTVE